MTVTIPIPVKFKLPDGWQAVDPEKAGAPGVAFAAVRRTPDIPVDGPVPSITLGEKERSENTLLADVADEALGRLVRIGHGVSLVRRTTYRSATVPGLAQLAALTVKTEGGEQRLVQYQVFLALPGDGRRFLIETALTATPEQFEQVGEEFGTYVSSIALDEPPRR